MKYSTTFASIISSLLGLAFVAAPVAAFADDAVTVNADGSTDQMVTIPGPNGPSRAMIHMHPIERATSTPPRKDGSGDTMHKPTGENMMNRADGAIDARIAKLNTLLARIDGAVRLSADMKASLKTELSAQVSALTSLKSKIAADTSTTTMKADAESITKAYRIYALVLPKAVVTAASDRIMTVVGQMQALSPKLSTRISAAGTAGADVSAAQSALTDFDAKVADASVQATAAVHAVASLSVDNGDKATLEANTAALKDAKTKIDAAQADLKAARADLDTILKAVKGKGEVKASASASAGT